jgi:hypothetical protein
MNIQIDASQFARLGVAFARAPDLAAQLIGAAMDDVVLLLQREISDASPRGITSALSGGWFSNVVNLSGTVVGFVGTSVEYAESVELGTKPHFPPVEALQDWVEGKLGLSGSEARTVAFLIARKISKVGTKPAHMVRDTWARNADYIARQIGAAIQQLLNRLEPA